MTAAHPMQAARLERRWHAELHGAEQGKQLTVPAHDLRDAGKGKVHIGGREGVCSVKGGRRLGAGSAPATAQNGMEGQRASGARDGPCATGPSHSKQREGLLSGAAAPQKSLPSQPSLPSKSKGVFTNVVCEVVVGGLRLHLRRPNRRHLLVAAAGGRQRCQRCSAENKKLARGLTGNLEAEARVTAPVCAPPASGHATARRAMWQHAAQHAARRAALTGLCWRPRP